jgi:hypothetical protein
MSIGGRNKSARSTLWRECTFALKGPHCDNKYKENGMAVPVPRWWQAGREVETKIGSNPENGPAPDGTAQGLISDRTTRTSA